MEDINKMKIIKFLTLGLLIIGIGSCKKEPILEPMKYNTAVNPMCGKIFKIDNQGIGQADSSDWWIYVINDSSKNTKMFDIGPLPVNGTSGLLDHSYCDPKNQSW